MSKITTKLFDMNGFGIGRVWRHYVRSFLIPIGYYNRGPGYKCLGLLMVLHYLGRPACWAHVYYQKCVNTLRRCKWWARRLFKS
jgi:hypothetical protein